MDPELVVVGATVGVGLVVVVVGVGLGMIAAGVAVGAVELPRVRVNCGAFAPDSRDARLIAVEPGVLTWKL